jgi:serine phosphatase RsbU (regulator of sigma subunit)
MFRSDGSVLGALSVGWDTDVELGPLLRGALLTLTQMCAAALERGWVREERNGFLVALQRALLPPVPEVSGLDIAARYLPPNNTLGFGGDWYDLFEVGPTLFAVIVGDVCGHGIEAAAAMAQLRGSFNALTRIFVDSLGDLFDHVERWLPALPDFVATVAVHVVDTTTGTVRYVSAGHPPSTIMRTDGRALTLDEGRRPVLGMGGRRPDAGIARLEPGDALVADTDGLLERRDRSLDEGIADVAQVVRTARSGSAEVIADALEAAIDWSPVDDVAFTVVRRTPR